MKAKDVFWKVLAIAATILTLGYAIVYILAQKAAASAMEVAPDPQQLASVLVWLGTGGAVAAINWVLANFLEKQTWWNGLPTLVKYLLPPVAAVLLGIGANELVKFDELVNAIQPYWFIIANIILAYFGSQLGHVMTKKKLEGAG